MKNFSIGVDIEEVARFTPLIRNKKFLARIFTPQEIAYCRSKKNSAQHFAVRFAAKEAVWKALSDTLVQLRRQLGHRDIGLRNNRHGKPEVILPAALKKWVNRIAVSLSHTDRYVVATALVKS